MKPLILSTLASTTLLLSACSQDNSDALAQSQPHPGEAIFTKTCKVCHAQGINGAPIPGNNKMWAKRRTQPLETLVQHASEGYGLMPAKGGNTELTDAELKLAIEFMLSKLDQEK